MAIQAASAANLVRRPVCADAMNVIGTFHCGRLTPASTLQRGPEQIRYPLLLKLSFGRHLSKHQREAFIEAHRHAHIEKLKAYNRRVRELHEHGDPHAMAILAFGINYEHAVLSWLDQLPSY